MLRNLLIVAAGEHSLHSAWIESNRTYDILIMYYGEDPEIGEKYKAESDFFYCESGLKLELARKILLSDLYFKSRINFNAYEYIWFPDDDLEFVQGAGLNLLFENAKILSADVFQPAVANENISSRWEAVCQIDAIFAHKVNIVEIMAHGFSGHFFANVYLPMLHVLDYMRAGWGLEVAWTKLGEAVYKRRVKTYVLDSCPVNHARPVGAGNSWVHLVGRYESLYLPQIYNNRMRIEHNVVLGAHELHQDEETITTSVWDGHKKRLKIFVIIYMLYSRVIRLIKYLDIRRYML